MDTLSPHPPSRGDHTPTRRPAGTRAPARARRSSSVRPAAPANLHERPSAIAALRLEPFPLWLAERDDRRLTRVPCVAAEDGRVVHANPVARRHGVSRGMRLEGARLRVEHLHVVEHHEPDLARAWADLLHELTTWSPWVQSGRRGLALVRLPARDAAELARDLHARVGLAADRQSAELAAASALSGTVREVEVDHETAFLERLPLRFLRAVGLAERDLTRLRWLGLRSAADLARWTPSQLRGYLGPDAAALLPYLHGPRDERLAHTPPPERLRRQLHCDEPLLEPAQLLPALERLARDVGLALAGRSATLLTLEAVAGGDTWRATRRAKVPLTSAGALLRQAHAALHDSGVAAAQAAGHGVDALALELAEPRRAAHQEGLWATRAQRDRALDAVSERFPAALVEAHVGDPYAPANDHAWCWRPHDPAASAPATATLDVAHEAVPSWADAVATVRARPWLVGEPVVRLPAPIGDDRLPAPHAKAA